MEDIRASTIGDKERDGMENGKCERCGKELDDGYSFSLVVNHPNYFRGIREFCSESCLRNFYRNNDRDW